MILKIKSFIYRFSDIFGFRVYLAEKEEAKYLKSLEDLDEIKKGIYIGIWHANHGFTTIYNYTLPFYKTIKSKIIHAFTFNQSIGINNK
jgi:hypothetical protein